MILELERAQRVRDASRWRPRSDGRSRRSDRSHQASPVRWCVMLPDPVEHRVAHVDVRRRHVDLRAQHVRAVVELAGAHAREQVEVLGDRAIAVRAVPARLGQRAAVLADLVGASGRRRRPGRRGSAARRARRAPRSSPRRRSRPVQSKPSHCTSALIDVDVLDVFLGRVGVVEAQVAAAAELARDAEVQADRLGVADVQVAVRLRRKARRDAPRMTRRPDVLRDDRANEVEGFGRAGRGHLGRALLYRWTGSEPRLGPFSLTASDESVARSRRPPRGLDAPQA